MQPLTVVKFGGSTLGPMARNIPRVVARLGEIRRDRRVVAVFSAPTLAVDGATKSMTDVALAIGASYAQANRVDATILSKVYEDIAQAHVPEPARSELLRELAELARKTALGLADAAENRRFAGVTRARVLAYSGEVAMARVMDYVLRANGFDSCFLPPGVAPIVTDDSHDDARFLLEESRAAIGPLVDAIDKHSVVAVAGFIGRSTLDLETTFERGGSDRTAVDLGILLQDRYAVTVDFEKDTAVLSAEPSIDRRGLSLVTRLSYGEARSAALFGMKILDPLAIRELQEVGFDVPLTVTDIQDPTRVTEIRATPDAAAPPAGASPIKIVTGRRNCAIVRMDNAAAAHLVVALTAERRYFEFLQLSQFSRGEQLLARLLFLDAGFVRRQEKFIRSYDRQAEIVTGRGVVTVVGDEMGSIPNLASIVTGAVGAQGIRIRNIDFQEETCRLVLVVDDEADNVTRAIRAVHGRRHVDTV